MKRTIEIKFLPRPSIEANQDCNMVFNIEADLGVAWMDPIINYLKDVSLPDDRNEAHHIRA